MTPPAYVTPFAAAMLAMSAALLACCAWMAARRFGATAADRFWIFVAAVVAQIGTIVSVLSLAPGLTPMAVLPVQCFFAALLWGTRTPVDDMGWQGVRAVFATRRRWLLLLLIALFLLLGLWKALGTPIHTFDDRMYRASRA